MKQPDPAVHTGTVNRRELLGASCGTALALIAPPALARPRAIRWTFDSLRRIGGYAVTVEGNPRMIATPLGRAVAFNGMGDALFIPSHPLAGARTWTFEALFRPDGGAFEQRWFHLESISPAAVPPDYDGSRILFEIRVAGAEWWLDTFIRGDGYRQPLIDDTKRWPIGRWHHVAQTYDGAIYRAYVNGVLQAQAAVAFKPQAAGRASVGIRYTRTSPFNGAVRQAAFVSGAALAPGHFVLPYPADRI